MADQKTDEKTTKEEAERSFKEIMGTLADGLIRAYAIQLLLHQKGILDSAEVDALFQRLNELPQFRSMREAYGSESSQLDQLLRDYKGPIQ